MRGFAKFAACASLAALHVGSAAAQDAPMLPSDETRVENAANRFFEALRSDDKTLLAEIMRPDGMLMIADRTNRDAPNLVILSNADYLESHAKRDLPVDEVMEYDIVLARDGIAQVWGPYRFMVDGVTTNCGINSMSFVENADGVWQLGNATFTMVAPEDCDNLDAPMEPTP